MGEYHGILQFHKNIFIIIYERKKQLVFCNQFTQKVNKTETTKIVFCQIFVPAAAQRYTPHISSWPTR